MRTNQLDFDDEVAFAAERAIFDSARSKDARPFLLVASFAHPHDPFAVPQRYWDLYRDSDIDMPARAIAPDALDPHSRRLRHVSAMDAEPVTDAEVRNARRAYYGAISYIDDHLGRLMGALRSAGLAEDTIVVLTSDHGEMLGERGLWYKMSFFEGACRVPLVVANPDRFTPRRVASSVSLVDLFPTLIDISGGDAQLLGTSIDGRSLGAHLHGKAGHDEAIGEYLAEGAIAPLVMIRRGEFKFIHSAPDPDQLFDLKRDPGERENLAGTAAVRRACRRLSRRGRAALEPRRIGQASAREPAPAPAGRCGAQHRRDPRLGFPAVPRCCATIHPQLGRPRRPRSDGPLSARRPKNMTAGIGLTRRGRR